MTTLSAGQVFCCLFLILLPCNRSALPFVPLGWRLNILPRNNWRSVSRISISHYLNWTARSLAQGKSLVPAAHLFSWNWILSFFHHHTKTFPVDFCPPAALCPRSGLRWDTLDYFFSNKQRNKGRIERHEILLHYQIISVKVTLSVSRTQVNYFITPVTSPKLPPRPLYICISLFNISMVFFVVEGCMKSQIGVPTPEGPRQGRTH